MSSALISALRKTTAARKCALYALDIRRNARVAYAMIRA